MVPLDPRASAEFELDRPNTAPTSSATEAMGTSGMNSLQYRLVAAAAMESGIRSSIATRTREGCLY